MKREILNKTKELMKKLQSNNIGSRKPFFRYHEKWVKKLSERLDDFFTKFPELMQDKKVLDNLVEMSNESEAFREKYEKHAVYKKLDSTIESYFSSKEF